MGEPRVAAALSQTLDTYYADHAIYTLRASDAKQLAERPVLRSVAVQERQLGITLGIGP